MSLIKVWLSTLFPNKKHINRHEWLKTITLPQWTATMNEISNSKPISVHDMIDKYLTHDERYELLLRYGWAKAVVIDGQTKYYQVNRKVRLRLIGHHLQHAEFMRNVNNNLMPSYTGEKY